MKEHIIKLKVKLIEFISSRAFCNLGMVLVSMALTAVSKNIVLFCFLMFLLIIWNIVEDQYEVYEETDSKGEK